MQTKVSQLYNVKIFLLLLVGKSSGSFIPFISQRLDWFNFDIQNATMNMVSQVLAMKV